MDNLQRPEYAHAKALRRTRYTVVFAALAAAFLAMIILNINTGSVSIPVGRILRILFLRQGEANEVSIIWKIRMPRILQAAILGGALALSVWEVLWPYPVSCCRPSSAIPSRDPLSWVFPPAPKCVSPSS